jgi:hypothetical protein
LKGYEAGKAPELYAPVKGQNDNLFHQEFDFAGSGGGT